jgi:predicted transcriptional regulator
MSILKNDLVDNYFKVSNYIFKYKLSSGAFQLYSYLVSRPSNWKIINQDIKSTLDIGSDHTLSKYWKELIDKGVLERERIKDEQGKCKGGFNYIVVNLLFKELQQNNDNSGIAKNQVLLNSGIAKNQVLLKSGNATNWQYINNTDINKTKYINKTNINKKEELVFDFNSFDNEEIEYIEKWFDYKKEIKKPLKTKSSYTALRNQLLKLKANGTLKPSIDICIANGWTGLYEQKHFINKENKESKESKITHDTFKNVERTGPIVVTDW